VAPRREKRVTEYNGPNVYRVVDVHPAAEIEFSGEEINEMIPALGWARMQFPDEAPNRKVLDDVIDRLRRAYTEIRMKQVKVEGERKRYAE
jgi:hypothetical protein